MSSISAIYLQTSYDRCRALGIDPNSMPVVSEFLEEDQLKRRLREKASDVGAASNLLDRFVKILQPHTFLSCFCDWDGVLLRVHANESIKGLAEFLKIRPGAVYKEEYVGTNAITLAIEYDTALKIEGSQHFHSCYNEWVCYAAPIHDLDGEITGAISALLPINFSSNIIYNTFVAFAELIEDTCNYRREHRIIRL